MDTNQFSITSFQEELSYCQEHIKITVQHFNCLFDLESMPEDVSIDLRSKAERCMEIFEKYSTCVLDVEDPSTQQCAHEIMQTLDEEMFFVFDYLMELNLALMNYGDGPSFISGRIFCTQPLEV